MPGAALPRAAEGHHPNLHLDPKKDVILFCAPSIPGQESYRERLLWTLRNKGFQVITRKEAPLYSQAHARLPELIEMAKMTAAKTILPAHGDEHLRGECAAAMRKMGQNVIEAGNGDVIRVTKKGCRSAEPETKNDPKLLAFKTMQGKTWSERDYIMTRLPQKNPQTPANGNAKPRPRIFDASDNRA